MSGMGNILALGVIVFEFNSAGGVLHACARKATRSLALGEFIRQSVASGYEAMTGIRRGYAGEYRSRTGYMDGLLIRVVGKVQCFEVQRVRTSGVASGVVRKCVYHILH